VTIHRYLEPGKWEHYATQDALLGGALLELGELEKELERCIVLGQYEEAGPRRRYEEVRRRIEEVAATYTFRERAGRRR